MSIDRKNLFSKLKDKTLYKLSASGNDFIFLLNLDKEIDADVEGPSLAKALCRPKFSVSADGFILVEKASSPEAQFSWRFFNSDGSEAEMCGNGARCFARLLFELGLCDKTLSFETKAGLIKAEVKGKRVKVKLTTPKDLKLNLAVKTEHDIYLAHFVNTGVPHLVLFWEDVSQAPVEKLGRTLRYHEMFAPAGTNVNFVELGEEDGKRYLKVRTYERGIEAETLACGTGASASAYVALKLGLIEGEVPVLTKGGEWLTIALEGEDLFLEGDTKFLFSFQIFEDALY